MQNVLAKALKIAHQSACRRTLLACGLSAVRVWAPLGNSGLRLQVWQFPGQSRSDGEKIRSYGSSLKRYSSTSKNVFEIDKRETSGLKAIFEPSSVALIGATERVPSVGRTVIENLIKGFKARSQSCKIYPVNPTRKEVLGLPCYPSVEAIPDEVDMVVIVTPSKTCLDMMAQCARKKVKAAIVISAGFKEAGPAGVQLEKDLISLARDAGIRVVGPNCVGVMNPNYGLNATFAATMGLPGNVAFISQSGAMCTAILDWSLRENVGFSAFVSIGSMADVHWGDLLDYLGSDPNTASIIIYMEAIGDVNAFLSAAKEVGLKKPITVIKAGKSDAAAQAAASHTGSLAGSYRAFEAAMHRAGVITAQTIQELADLTLYLSKQPLPKGPKLTIITNAGGPAVLATDAAVEAGAEISKLQSETLEKLNQFLPAAWSHNNPVDILGDAPAALYAKTLEVLMEDPGSDGILVVLSPQDVTDPTGTAQALIAATQKIPPEKRKPVLAAWMGGDTVKEGTQLLTQAGIPAFTQSDAAAATFGKLWKHALQLQQLYGETEYQQSPFLPDESSKEQALQLIRKAAAEGRTLLTEFESKQLLQVYGIKTAQTIIATTPEELLAAADKIPFEKYAVKLHSNTITHKADVKGVHLNLNKSQLAEAFAAIKDSVTSLRGAEHFQGVTLQPMLDIESGIELILGSTTDPQFGPVILFGGGGTMVEVWKDTALALPPLTDNICENLLKQTKVYKALKGGQQKRFPGVNISSLKDTLTRFSQMSMDLAGIVKECDINPLLATRDSEFVALDARFVLEDEPKKDVIVAERKYPAEYVTTIQIPSFGEIQVRPTLPSDKDQIRAFHAGLSDDTVAKRYLSPIPLEERTSLEHMISICYPNYDRQITLVAIKDDQILAMCELERPPANHLNRECAQLRLTVADAYQNKNIGEHLTRVAMNVAKQEGIKQIQATTSKNNVPFTKLVARLGWSLNISEHDDGFVTCLFKV